MDDALKDRLDAERRDGQQPEERAADIAREQTSGIAQLAPDSALTRRPRISPINQRRWRNFKANRRGYWSL